MKPILTISFFIAFSLLVISLNGQSNPKQSTCAEDDECCKKVENKKSTKMSTPNVISPVKKENAVVCKLTSPELQKRKAEVIALLKANILERKEITNGYQFSFKGSDNMLDDLVSFIKAERDCCSFFIFNLSIEDNDTNIRLSITGPEGTKEFINSEIEL